MAANIVILTEAEWDVFARIAAELDEGGIIVSPTTAAAILERHGIDPVTAEFERLVDYDYGGSPDLYVDIAEAREDGGNMAYDAVVAAITGEGVDDDEEDDDEEDEDDDEEDEDAGD